MIPEQSALLLATRRAQSADGTVIAYYATEAPRPDAPTVVLAGGLGGHHRAWSPQIAYFGDRLRFVTWDYRGLFGSAHPRPDQADAYSMACQLQDLEAVLEAEHLGQVALVGWSMGVEVALEAYAHMPQRVSCLVLINGTASRPLGRLEAVPGHGRLLRRLVGLAAHGNPVLAAVVRNPARRRILASGLVRLGLVAESVDAELFDRLVADLTDLDLTAYARTLQAMAEHDATPVLARVAVPTLVIAGERDPFTGAASTHALARHIPTSEILMVPGGGHYLCLEYPDLVNLRMERFFTSLGLC
jgi:pimeloyl-ACP methyl ester carboxylesterase